MKNKKLGFIARTILFIFVLILYMSSKQPKPVTAATSANVDSTTTAKTDTSTAIASPYDTDITLTPRYNLFDTTVDVIFTDTKDSIGTAQKENYDGFVARQDELTKVILQKIFINYRANYLDYKKIWLRDNPDKDDEVGDNVPKPTTAEALIPYISPEFIEIPSKKKNKVGTLNIYFSCTWRADGSTSAIVNNWQVVKVFNTTD